jgi:hypothetical protein
MCCGTVAVIESGRREVGFGIGIAHGFATLVVLGSALSRLIACAFARFLGIVFRNDGDTSVLAA